MGFDGQHNDIGVKVPPARPKRAWLLLALFACVVTALGLYGAGLYGRDIAMEDTEDQARVSAGLKVALLRAVLERPRSLPLLLAEDQQVLDALTLKTASAVARLNDKLERLVAATSASVLYVTNADGVAIASSNWQEATSFVGVDYSFRDYFKRSMSSGTAEHFALGSISKRPGLYISRRVGPETAPEGVVVVKAEFDQLESDWLEVSRAAFVTDRHGVVLISSIPSWRFMTLSTLLPDEVRDIRTSLQFGNAPLAPLPFNRAESIEGGMMLVRAVLPGDVPANYLYVSMPVPTTNWQLNYLVPVDAAIASTVRELRLLMLAVLVPFFLICAVVLWRRQAGAIRFARAEANQLELERRVDERTMDLLRARDRLEAEIAGHRATEGRLQVVQQELVQANRLAILGQVAAGVAHEINQPVATIRAFAENAIVFLERQQIDIVKDNLTSVSALTARIGSITEELKAFARKGRTAPQPVLLRDVVDGAVVLLRSRFAGRLDALKIQALPDTLVVKGNRIRLEQVLINLFQNALEALDDAPDARVEISAQAVDDEVIVTVQDNGPGIPSDIRPLLFTPFSTSKEKGLGLGLVISRDIISDYGGRLLVESNDRGTTFTIHLLKADL
ncbi:two-component system C4-dicarboxylate transport sensor histidine kinase DctB [Agrobacterium vitis]|nr:two-component system C4-dicarboxylate transport sensor histidine kinase DctB [Agrobacterium vitis]MBE1436678.1 two-component system C4-dicarboxylate transport sensor histidine kinase DctB [Agrobacterium vitis]